MEKNIICKCGCGSFYFLGNILRCVKCNTNYTKVGSIIWYQKLDEKSNELEWKAYCYIEGEEDKCECCSNLENLKEI